MSSGACRLGTRGEVAGSASVRARGVCGDLAGCCILGDCPCFRTSPATWKSGARHRSSFPAVPALSSACWGWTGPRGGGREE